MEKSTGAEETIRIQMLGGFSVCVGQKCITSSDAGGQVWNLLQYLVYSRSRPQSADQLMTALWDNETEDPAAALKNLVYRLRKEFQKAGVACARDIVLSSGGAYHWNNELSCQVDSEQFEAACRAADRAAEAGRDPVEACRTAVELYTGDFLPGAYYRVWVIPANRYYHELFFKQAYRLMRIYEQRAQWKELLDTAMHAVHIDEFEEDAQYYVMLSLAQLGRTGEALRRYTEVSDLFYREMGTKLSARLSELFGRLSATSKESSSSLDALKSELRETTTPSGAYYCEYEIFKSLYRMRARSAGRDGSSVFLGLLTISPQGDAPLDTELRGQAMRVLHQAIEESLRSGDVFSRCTGTQYLVMLPQVNFENGEKVLKRIIRKFKTAYLARKVEVNYSLQPLEPLEK